MSGAKQMTAVSPTQQSTTRLALFVDGGGLADLWPRLPCQARICAIVGAGIRPQYFDVLARRAAEAACPFLVQPRRDDPAYADFVAQLAGARPTRLLVHSYSMILRPEVLELVDYDALNVHAALLPRNRGPNPIQWAMIHDEPASGVSLHYLDEGLDTGPVVARSAVAIEEEDTWVTLAQRVHAATQQLLDAYLPGIVAGGLACQAQVEDAATRNPRLNADSPRLDVANMTDRQLFNWIRAQVRPLGGAYVERGNGERLHVPEYVPMRDIAALRGRLRAWLEQA
ncbi:methionyl-tRNA formyltransferase [Bordetella hinzii]|uniref:methionyl-tRNA formyltransferase n=1 Tax=Bordetella hinzii TaxID=103855 RepID=UPI001F1004F9|nr:formyltransferase family protein [Bordetella hinzii]